MQRHPDLPGESHDAHFAVMIRWWWDGVLQVFVDLEVAELVFEALEDDDIVGLHRMQKVKDLRAQRRRLLGWSTSGKAVVFSAEPGAYELELRSWADQFLAKESIELTPGSVGYWLFDSDELE